MLNGNAATKRNWRRTALPCSQVEAEGSLPGKKEPAACARRALARHDGPVQCWTRLSRRSALLTNVAAPTVLRNCHRRVAVQWSIETEFMVENNF